MDVKNIAAVAHRWNTQYDYSAEYLSRGFTQEEIAVGSKLGHARYEEYSALRAYYGNPAYGSWPADVKLPLTAMIAAMGKGEDGGFAAWLEVESSKESAEEQNKKYPYGVRHCPHCHSSATRWMFPEASVHQANDLKRYCLNCGRNFFPKFIEVAR